MIIFIQLNRHTALFIRNINYQINLYSHHLIKIKLLVYLTVNLNDLSKVCLKL